MICPCGRNVLYLVNGRCKECKDVVVEKNVKKRTRTIHSPETNLQRKIARLKKQIISGEATLRQCANPDCGKSFYAKHKSVKYCCYKCARKVNNEKCWSRKQARNNK